MPMSIQNPNERLGKVFDANVIEQTEVHPPKKTGRYFDGSFEENSNKSPDSICIGEKLPKTPDYSSLQLKALPLKGVKFFVVTLFAAMAVYVGIEIKDTFTHAMTIHWLIAGLFAIFVCASLATGAYVFWGLIGSKGDEKIIENIRNHATDIRMQHDCGMSALLLEKLDNFYQYKPQGVHWRQCKTSIPDYSDDREVLKHIEHIFLRKLDKEAQRRISKHSALIGVAVAASPWVFMDMFFSFWRNFTMIIDISQVYGVRPSLKNKAQLIWRVCSHMAASSVTELAIHQMAQDVCGQVTLKILSARIAQGFGVGVYSAKIGLTTMQICRPVEFEKSEAPSLAEIASQLKHEISAWGRHK